METNLLSNLAVPASWLLPAKEAIHHRLLWRLTYDFSCHEDQADHRCDVEFPSSPLLFGIVVAASSPVGMTMLVPREAQLDGGRVWNVLEHGIMKVLLGDAQIGPE